MSNLAPIYQDFLISSYGKIEMTKFSKVFGKGFSHVALKEKIYIEALKASYEKVLELECA